MRAAPEWLAAEEARRRNWTRGAQLGLVPADVELEQAPDGTLTPAKPQKRPSVAPEVLERDIQKAVLRALRLHPLVAWAMRMNSGVFRVGDPGEQRFVRAAFKGCSDILGQMRDGRLIACEVKRRGERATPEQSAFLTHVREHNGVAFVAFSVDDVGRNIEEGKTDGR